MTVTAPPIYEPVVGDDGKARIPWILFFNQIFKGDAGSAWPPTFVDLTEVGTPTIEGYYYKITDSLVFFHVNISPSTSTTSTAGTTYIDNFPLTFSNDGVCWAVSGGLGDGPGHIVASTNRIYVPAWTAVTVDLTVIGIGEAK